LIVPKEIAMTPTETLKHEHQIILMVLQAADHEADKIEKTGRVDAPKVRQFLEFFREFVDRCHHAKEEQHLFVQLKSAAPQAAGPVSVMLREHEEGRRKIAALAKVVDKTDADSVAAACEGLRTYAELLRQHIAKEDNVLYPLADQVLDADDQQALTEQFAFVESQELGEGVHEKYHQLAHDLASEE
jgi:hemerythrin-like domain-containing protein